MPVSYPIAPWMHGVSADTLASVTASGVRAGAELAERSREASLEAQAKRDALQAQILRAQAELAVDESYKKMTLSLRASQQQEAQRRNMEQAQIAMERARMTDAHNLEMEKAYRERTAEADKYHTAVVARQLKTAPDQDRAYYARMAQGVQRELAIARRAAAEEGILPDLKEERTQIVKDLEAELAHYEALATGRETERGLGEQAPGTETPGGGKTGGVTDYDPSAPKGQRLKAGEAAAPGKPKTSGGLFGSIGDWWAEQQRQARENYIPMSDEDRQRMNESILPSGLWALWEGIRNISTNPPGKTLPMAVHGFQIPPPPSVAAAAAPGQVRPDALVPPRLPIPPTASPATQLNRPIYNPLDQNAWDFWNRTRMSEIPAPNQ